MAGLGPGPALGTEILVLSRWPWVSGRLVFLCLRGPCGEAVGDAGLPGQGPR